MRNRPNILFSTTHMWNCGDDFINIGVMNILQTLIGPFNPILYNRHPALHLLRSNIIPKDIQQHPRRYHLNNELWAMDNSWYPNISLKSIDCVVYSGPEWCGIMLDPLTEQLLERDIPIIFLGIGCLDITKDLHYQQLPKQDRAILEKAHYISVRDHYMLKLLEPLQPIINPCPALLSSKQQRKRQSLKKIALCLQSGFGYQRLKTADIQYTMKLFNKLIPHYECALVCHRIEELVHFDALPLPHYFSYDPKDYFAIYDQFDLTISTRVHGTGICASLGIPGFIIQHSARSDTANGFLTDFIPINPENIDEMVEKITSLNIAETSENIITHKAATMETYLSQLASVKDLL